MKTQSFILFFVVLTFSVSMAQTDLTKAQEMISKGQYDKAIKSLEQSYKLQPKDIQVQLTLARAYKANGQSAQSLKLYQQITSAPNPDPAGILEYADLLRHETNYPEAKVQYLRYAQFNPSAGAYFAGACDYAMNQLSSPKNCELEKLKSNQTMAVVYKDEVLTDSKNINDITTKEAIPANPTAPILVKKSTNINKKHLEEILGTNSLEKTNMSFNEDGNIVAFAQMSMLHDDQKKNINQNREIFFAKVDDNGKWSEVSAFEFNNPSFSFCYPNLANNGKTLYFSSNIPGGFGGYDLYVSNYIGNKWTSPVNLGAVINSPGNEISPYYKAGDLFYSSDFIQGFGGFDVFRTSQYGLVWTDVENLGPCVNSNKDDYNFVLDQHNDAYFNSNRIGAESSNGIFKTSKLVLKSNIPTLRAIPNDEVAIKSILVNDPQEAIGSLENPNIVTSVDDPAIGFLSKEQQAVKLYFVQIAAITTYTPAAESRLKNYTKYGNVYKTIEGNVTKIRIGGYNNLNEALALLKVLRKNGFKDIFVVADIPTEGRCILVYKASNDFNANVSPDLVEGKLKIRVAEFKAPDWFDSSKISDLGKIEHWTKNGWTIIVLGAFNTPAEAISMLDKVKSRGYPEAYIVVEENGRLYRQN